MGNAIKFLQPEILVLGTHFLFIEFNFDLSFKGDCK